MNKELLALVLERVVDLADNPQIDPTIRSLAEQIRRNLSDNPGDLESLKLQLQTLSAVDSELRAKLRRFLEETEIAVSGVLESVYMLKLGVPDLMSILANIDAPPARRTEALAALTSKVIFEKEEVHSLEKIKEIALDEKDGSFGQEVAQFLEQYNLSRRLFTFNEEEDWSRILDIIFTSETTQEVMLLLDYIYYNLDLDRLESTFLRNLVERLPQLPVSTDQEMRELVESCLRLANQKLIRAN